MSSGLYLLCPPSVRIGVKKSANSLSQYLSVCTSTPVIRLATLMLTAWSALLCRRSVAILIPRFLRRYRRGVVPGISFGKFPANMQGEADKHIAKETQFKWTVPMSASVENDRDDR